MICPNGKRFDFLRSAPVKGNQFGRTEEYYQCEDCTGCLHNEIGFSFTFPFEMDGKQVFMFAKLLRREGFYY